MGHVRILSFLGLTTQPFVCFTCAHQVARPKEVEYQFRTQRKVPKLGLMLVGWGGNNGSTCTAGILANKMKMEWETKHGTQKANYFGSVTQASTCRLGGHGPNHQDVHIPFSSLLPIATQ